MKSGIPIWLTIGLALFFCLRPALRAEESSWSLELRIAAHPEKDKSIVDKAKSSQQASLYEGESLIAKWVPVLQRSSVELLAKPQLVTRRNDKGQVELLVLITAQDITEEHIVRIRRGQDIQEGQFALDVKLDNTGGEKLYSLTLNCLKNGSCVRNLAGIINGQVYAVHEIRGTVRENFQIPLDLPDEAIEAMVSKLGSKFQETPMPPIIKLTPFRVVVFLFVVFLLIFGLLPAHNLPESKHPYYWVAAGVILGIVIGGYWFGVTKSSAGPDNQDGIPPWAEIIQISIVNVLLCSVIGGIFGMAGGYILRIVIRRAIHNIYRVTIRGFSGKT